MNSDTYNSHFCSVTNINWEQWINNVLASLPAECSLNDRNTIESHLLDAVRELKSVKR